MTTSFKYIFLCLVLLSLPATILTFQANKSLLDTIVKTINQAKTYFDIAKEVADLVSQSFNETSKQNHEITKSFRMDGKNNIFKHTMMDSFFRMMKLDSPKVIAIAVNSVIFLAQLISTLFDMKTTDNFSNGMRSKNEKSTWDPMKYILNHKSERVKRLVELAENPDLPSQLIDRVDGYEFSCFRLLLCKITPIIWAAQKSLKDKSAFQNHKLTSWLPSWKKFEDYSDNCEVNHNNCVLLVD